MDIVLNNPTLVKYDLMEKDAIFLLSLGFPITNDSIEFLVRENFIQRIPTGFQLLDKGNEAIAAFKNAKAKPPKIAMNVSSLTSDLRSLFPEGRKGETPYYWKGNQPEIEKRLVEFKTKNPTITDDLIIQATKNYVSAFGGNKMYMQLLKYFIEKGGSSTLLSYIENIKSHKVVDKEDWTVGVK